MKQDLLAVHVVEGDPIPSAEPTWLGGSWVLRRADLDEALG